MPIDPAHVEEEQIAFQNVITTFQQYAPYAVTSFPSRPSQNSTDYTRPQLTANNRRRKDFFTLPRADRELLEGLGYKEKLAEVDKAILANAEFLSKIVDNPAIFGHDDGDEDEDEEGLEDDEDELERQEDVHVNASTGRSG